MSRTSKLCILHYFSEKANFILAWIYKTNQLVKPLEVNWYVAIYKMQIMK